MTTNETHLLKNDELKIEGYKSYSRNRQNAAKGGIATSIKTKHADYAFKISEGKDVEYIVTRHGQFQPPINVINYYGSQESRQKIEEINHNWECILKEIIEIENKREGQVLIKDANYHIGSSHVKENHPKTSVGGKHLIDLVSSGEYILVNSLDICKGGPFTRYDPSDPNNNAKKSLLDVIVVSKNLLKYIEKLDIDSKLEWTPYSQYKGHLKYHDHYALLLVFNQIPMRKQIKYPGKKFTIWNTKKMVGKFIGIKLKIT